MAIPTIGMRKFEYEASNGLYLLTRTLKIKYAIAEYTIPSNINALPLYSIHIGKKHFLNESDGKIGMYLKKNSSELI